jgi:hypothetical protein
MINWIHQQIQNGKDQFTKEVMRVLDSKEIEVAFKGFTQRKRVYHLEPLLETFLSQVMTGRSCREAIALGISDGTLPAGTSPKNAAYCNARSRLPETPLLDLTRRVGQSMSARMTNTRRFMGRPVKVGDGTNSQLLDTPANQKEYPQPKGQASGCGFPILFFTALMDLDTGGIEDIETWGGGSNERTAFRKLWRSLKKGDIVLGDGGLGSYADIALLLGRGIDSVFEVGMRKFDLPAGDHLVTLTRPERLPQWVRAEDLPESLTLRVIRFRVKRPGMRPEWITIMTTLLDKRRYTKRKLMRLYQRRWDMELRLRDIKTTLGLEQLNSKSPAGCRKQLWMGLLGYNLIRMVMLAAAHRVHHTVDGISFAGTLQRLRTFSLSTLPLFDLGNGWLLLLDHLALDMLPYRPYRVEPRKQKHRKKNYRLLNRPRQVERQELLRA